MKKKIFFFTTLFIFLISVGIAFAAGEAEGGHSTEKWISLRCLSF